MEKINKLSIRVKISLFCIGCLIVALLLQTYFFQKSSSAIIYSQANEISQTTLHNLQNDLYNFNKSIENSLIKTYNNKEFMRDLSYVAEIDSLKESYSQVAYDLAYSAFEPSQNLTSLYVYTIHHALIGSYRHAQTPKYSYPDDIYGSHMEFDDMQIKSYVESDDRIMLITSYYNANRETTLIRYVLKLYKDTTDLAGYVVCDVDPKPFLQLLQKYRYSDGQIIWLQPNAGDVIAKTEGVRTQDQLFEEISEQVKKGADYTDIYDGNNYEFYHATEHKYNLGAHSLMPKKVLELNQTILFQNMALIVILIVLVFSFLLAIIFNSLTKPLIYMVETMNKIKRGKTNLRLRIKRKDELGILGDEFNDMLDEIEILIKREYDAKALAYDAKYKALQAQVNPHFLYNTLDTMSSIASAQNCSSVGTMCRALSNIFRYSLNMQSPFATLEEEILHIKNYMYIMNVRTNNSIRLEFKIDSDLLNIQVPRLSIQPLVENSIQHGLKNKRGDKEIIIGADKNDASMHIWVSDNGVGMDAESINKFFVNSVSQTLNKGESIGLNNIDARLKIRYGEDYGIRVESSIGIGSRIIIKIPLDANAEKQGEKPDGQT